MPPVVETMGPSSADRALIGAAEHRFLHACGAKPDLSPSEVFGTSDPVEIAEQIIKVHLQDLTFRFSHDKLRDLHGFMVVEDGYRWIVSDEKLDAGDRIALYFHLLGHIAKGHMPESGLAIRHEPHDRSTLSASSRLEEYHADRWAIRLVEKRLGRDCDPDNPFTEGALEAARRLGVRGPALKKLLHRLFKLLYENNLFLYRHLRDRPEMQAFLAATYYRWP